MMHIHLCAFVLNGRWLGQLTVLTMTPRGLSLVSKRAVQGLARGVAILKAQSCEFIQKEKACTFLISFIIHLTH